MVREDESYSNTEDDGVDPIGTVVSESELGEIVHRRRVALGLEESPEKVSQDLVGLAFSGGGVRSAALGLGILQSLYNRALLPFVDYLSTVSGGGYAGAYLSSVALKAGRKRQQGGAHHSDVDEDKDDSQDDAVDELFPIARKPTGQPPARMLRFIYGGDYLRKTWVFFNRYLIGLFLIWLVVISGAVAATSFIAWLFRCLDHTYPRAWAAALGFDGDIKLAFLPSFVLFFLWFFLWALSYLKFAARCTGFVARGVFYLLVIVTLVAIAALLGNGEYYIPGFAPDEDATGSAVTTTIYTVILTALGVALLPYLNPKRLVRSGMAPKGAAERYIFWVATRALAFGVPFILVAYFARENISNWNNRRDDRLARTEISYDLHAPLWRQVAYELSLEKPDFYQVLLPGFEDASGDSLDEEKKEKLTNRLSALEAHRGDKEFDDWIDDVWSRYKEAKEYSKQPADGKSVDGLRWINLKLLAECYGPRVRAPRLGDIWRETTYSEDGKAADRPDNDLNQLAQLFTKLKSTTLLRDLADSDLDELKELHHRIDKLDDYRRVERARHTKNPEEFRDWSNESMESAKGDLSEALRDVDSDADPDASAQDWDEIQAHVTESTPLNDRMSDTAFSFWTRWWHLAHYCGEVLTDTQTAQENCLYQMVRCDVRNREIRWHIASLLNKRLVAEDLYQTLLPKDLCATASDNQDSTPAEEKRGTDVRKADRGDSDIAEAFRLVAPYHPNLPQKTADAQEEWIENLRILRMQAAELAEQHRREKATDEYIEQGGLQDEREGDAKRIAMTQRERAVIAMNRRLLKAYYGNLIRDKHVVYSSVVLVEDQRVRLLWFFGSFGLFVLACLVVDMNATSWHGFYSTQIGKAWLEDVPGLGREIPLVRLETTDVGRPYHLINASLHLMGMRKDDPTVGREDFLFSKLYCGSSRLTYKQTSQYMDGKYALDDAIAVSGAAVSPVQTTNPLVLALLVLFNVRLGQWVTNPLCKPCSTKLGRFLRSKWPVTPLRILLSLFHDAETRPLCFVTDGGHHENLGIEPLLVRRCRLIIAMDAGQDGDYQFSDFTRLIRWSRLRHGIRFERLDKPDEPIDLKPLIPRRLADEMDGNGEREKEKVAKESELVDAVTMIGKSLQPKSRWSERYFLILKIRYPETAHYEAGDGYLVYIKATLTGGEPMELQQFQKSEPVFPHHPTADQFYDPVRFEAYTHLGYHMCESMGKSVGEQVQETGVPTSEFIRTFIRELNGGTISAAQAPRRRKAEYRRIASADKSRKSKLIAKLIEQLRSSNGSEQLNAAKRMEQLDEDFLCVTPDLLKEWSVAAEEEDLGSAAIKNFFVDHAHAAFDHVREAASHGSDAHVRRAGIRCLGIFIATESLVDYDAALDLILKSVQDEDVDVRTIARKELRALKKREVLRKREAEIDAALRSRKRANR